jgi:hypothetical protein
MGMDQSRSPLKKARRSREAAGSDLLSLRMAAAAGLTQGAKTKHLNAKVAPALFEAAARRAGAQSPSAVIEAALAALATQDDLGPWLAEQWGSLADVDEGLLGQIDL